MLALCHDLLHAYRGKPAKPPKTRGQVRRAREEREARARRNPRRVSELHGLVRTMVRLPSIHPSLLSDTEMLHEKFLRKFVAEHVDVLIGHRNRRRDLTNHLRRKEMDIVWWEGVVEMVFSSVFKLQPLYFMDSGENGLSRSVGPNLRDASPLARDKAIRDRARRSLLSCTKSNGVLSFPGHQVHKRDSSRMSVCTITYERP